MTFKFKIVSAILLSALLLVGCGKDDKVKPPTEPAMASGVTDVNGHATIDVGSFTVDVDVRNAAQVALPYINVDTYLLHNNVVIIARDPAAAYLPTVAVSSWSGSAKRETPDLVQSPVYIMGTSVQGMLVMQPIQSGVYSYQPDPPGLDAISSDEWTVETSQFGPLNQLYQLMDTSATYQQGVYIRLAPAVQQLLGSGARTAAFRLYDGIDFPTFATLCGVAFEMSDDDSLYYSLIDYTDHSIPMVNIDNIRMYRDFWAQFRLTWGENPSDLDSHLWTPLFGSNPYDSALAHVCYYRNGSVDAPPYADLDVDDVTSFGPERVTIYQHFPGTYVYAVHHFSGTGTFFSSAAKVSLLKPDGTVQLFEAPPDVPGVGDGWYWHVCQIDGQTGAITPLNAYSSNPPRGDVLANAPDKPVLENVK
ncbi:MAG: hypothetical protein A2W25_08310 [candidate division Zixibacteria bacterium RBG_16_53_22]|nr:MAG: hypothetical protein A2W25_08310 [candidate division Zixibacteria bacterium RBG_16_53_22]